MRNPKFPDELLAFWTAQTLGHFLFFRFCPKRSRICEIVRTMSYVRPTKNELCKTNHGFGTERVVTDKGDFVNNLRGLKTSKYGDDRG